MRRIFIYILLSTLVGVWGCRKDTETFRPYGSSIAEIAQLLSQVPGDATVTNFNFPSGLSTDTILSTTEGVRVFLTDVDHLFINASGEPVAVSTCGALRVEVSAAFKKGDILALGLPTATLSNGLLESGGMVRVRAFCNGQPLQLSADRSLKIQITTAQDALQPDMLVYGVALNADQTFAGWENTGQDVFWAGWPTPQGQKMGYELIVKKLDWVNCARPINEQSSQFCVSLPLAFNADNTEVYVVFKSQRTVTQLVYDPVLEKFCLPEGPIGYFVQVVSVTKAGNQYWLGNKETEIGNLATLSVTPEESTQTEVLAFLKGL